MTPLLLAFGIPIHIAVGTDLLYAGLTKTGGAIAHSHYRNVDWRIVGLLALGSIPGAITTLGVLSLIGTPAAYEQTLRTCLGIMLIVTAAVIIFRDRIRFTNINLPNHWVLPIFGALLGIAVALSSVGAGALTAAMLMLLFPLLKTSKIVGTDIVHAVPLTLIAGFGHWYLGNVDFVLLFSLLIGSIPAISLGARLAGLIPENIIRALLSVLLLGIGVKLGIG